jgi:large subunit ribosomal protein L15
MQAHQLKPPKGSTHSRKRVGRGNSSGHGTYSGRGLNGQKSRSGGKPHRYFEGGQTPIMRRLPRKRGFFNKFRVEFAPVNLRDLGRFDDGAEITPESLRDAGLIPNMNKPVKVLGTGEIGVKLTITAHRFSKSAREKIEAAGGTATALLPDHDAEAKRERKMVKRAKKKAAAAAKPVATEEKSDEPKAKDEEPAEAEESDDGDSS